MREQDSCVCNTVWPLQTLGLLTWTPVSKARTNELLFLKRSPRLDVLLQKTEDQGRFPPVCLRMSLAYTRSFHVVSSPPPPPTLWPQRWPAGPWDVDRDTTGPQTDQTISTALIIWIFGRDLIWKTGVSFYIFFWHFVICGELLVPLLGNWREYLTLG